MRPELALAEWLAAGQSRYVELLEHLVTTESHAAHPEGVEAIGETVMAELKSLGFEFQHKDRRGLHRVGSAPTEDPRKPRIVNNSLTYLGGPGGNRTHNLRVKSPLLCLVELPAQPQTVAKCEVAHRSWLMADHMVVRAAAFHMVGGRRASSCSNRVAPSTHQRLPPDCKLRRASAEGLGLNQPHPA